MAVETVLQPSALWNDLSYQCADRRLALAFLLHCTLVAKWHKASFRGQRSKQSLLGVKRKLKDIPWSAALRMAIGAKKCRSRWNWNFDRTFVGLGTKVGRKPLMSVGQLRRFASECEAMANGTRDPRDKQVWRGLAERWLRCAALIERDESDVRARRRDMPVLRKKDRGTIH